MDILYLLVPLSVLAVLALIAVFAWALDAGQFDDLDREGVRILEEDVTNDASSPALDRGAVSPNLDGDQTGRKVRGRH